MTLTVTHTTPADGTFSATGAAAWDANHALTVSGTSGQVQFNSSGDLAGDAGLTFDSTNKALTVGGGTVTASFPVLSASQTWNNAAVTFTGYKLNVTDTASNASSLLMDLQVGGASKFSVRKDGAPITSNSAGYRFYSYTAPVIAQVAGSTGINNIANGVVIYSNTNFADGGGQVSLGSYGTRISSTGAFTFSSAGASDSGSPDTILTRRGAANLRFGAADAASPIAQTLSVQSVVAGTTNTAGANLTITGSQGTGTGAGGNIVFQVAPAGTTGTAQNALSTALTIGSDRRLTLSAAGIAIPAPTTGNFVLQGYDSGSAPSLVLGTASTGLATINTSFATFQVVSNYAIGWAGPANFAALPDLLLFRDAANTLAQRNGVNAQAFRLYNTFTDASNYERGVFDFSTTANTLTIGTQNAGTGSARNIRFVVGGTAGLTLSASSATFNGEVNVGPSNVLGWGTGRAKLFAPTASAIRILPDSGDARLNFGGDTSSFPALKRSTTTLQARLADDSAFTAIQGQLTTDTAYVATPQVSTGYITIYDSTGTAYKVLVAP